MAEPNLGVLLAPFLSSSPRDPVLIQLPLTEHHRILGTVRLSLHCEVYSPVSDPLDCTTGCKADTI